MRRDCMTAVVGISEDQIPLLLRLIEKTPRVRRVRLHAWMLVQAKKTPPHLDHCRIDLHHIHRRLRKITRDILRHAKRSRADEKRALHPRLLAQQRQLPVFLIRHDQFTCVRHHPALRRGVQHQHAACEGLLTLLHHADAVIRALLLKDQAIRWRQTGTPAKKSRHHAAQNDRCHLSRSIPRQHKGRHGQQQQQRARAEKDRLHAEARQQHKAGEKRASKAAERSEHADRARGRAHVAVFVC